MQTLPVLGTLTDQIKTQPDARNKIDIVVRSNLDRGRLEAECKAYGQFSFATTTLPPVFPAMHNAFDVDVEESIKQCRHVYKNRNQLLELEMAFLSNHGFDAVLSNICPFSLAAARKMGLASIAMCSLNWAQVLAAIPVLFETCGRYIEFLEGIYRDCDLFLAPEPHVQTAPSCNLRTIAPIARSGKKQKCEILRVVQASQKANLVVVSSGGMDGFPFPIEFPELAGIFWILPDKLYQPGPDRLSYSDLGHMAYIDIIASADVLVMKPGYGLIVEAVANGVRIASVERNHWVDVASLHQWAQENGEITILKTTDFKTGRWTEKLQILLNTPAPPAKTFTGAQDAAQMIKQALFVK